VLQDTQVFRHGRLRNAGASRQGVNRLFAVAREALEDRAAGRIGEGFEDAVRYSLHARSITVRLSVVNSFLGVRPCGVYLHLVAEIDRKVSRGTEEAAARSGDWPSGQLMHCQHTLGVTMAGAETGA
jgi:hypothetical protein